MKMDPLALSIMYHRFGWKYLFTRQKFNGVKMLIINKKVDFVYNGGIKIGSKVKSLGFITLIWVISYLILMLKNKKLLEPEDMVIGEFMQEKPQLLTIGTVNLHAAISYLT